MLFLRAAVVLAATLLPVPTSAQDPPPHGSTVDRLAALGELYGAVRYFHPGLVGSGIDWDDAVARAVPLVAAATTGAAHARAVEQLLAVLDDPATRVRRGAGPERRLMFSTRDVAGTLIVSLVTASGSGSEGDVAAQVARARRVLFELRSDAVVDPEALAQLFAGSGIDGRLAAVPVQGGAQRVRVYSGYPPELGQSSGGYTVGWQQLERTVFEPAAGVVPKHVVFLLGEGVPVPPVAAALQAAGLGAILSHGPPSDAAIVRTHRVRLADGLEAVVRTGAVMDEAGQQSLRADSVLPPTRPADVDAARSAALDWLQRLAAGAAAPITAGPPGAGARVPAIGGAAATAPPVPVTAAQLDAARAVYPDEGYRLVALYRIWNTFRFFFPYRHLMDADWDSVFRASIPQFRDAGDSLQYHLAVARMLTSTQDAHVQAASATLAGYYGQATPPVRVRMIEDAPVITRIDDAIAAGAGLATGDIVLSVDGEAVADRLERLARHVTSSREQWQHSVARRLLAGPEGEAVLVVRGANGGSREVRVPRRREYWRLAADERGGDIVKIMPGNIGYVDLDRLARDSVDAMFEQLRDTDGIVFDMRGYPNGTAWLIAPRLTAATRVPAARFRRNIVASPASSEITSYNFMQQLPATTAWRYTRPTVMLIDERSISQSEHTGLFFRAANGTRFTGSATAGANGDVTNFTIPGGIVITFTGHDVRWPDDSQLQRVGLIPDVVVEPTIEGIRAGRDEVLEHALRLLGGLKGSSDVPPRAIRRN